jgi:hypothetical protein
LERRKSLFDRLNPNHTFSWIYNWTIWKNYWGIVYDSFENCLDFDAQVKNFEKLIKFNEYLHLRFSLATQNKKNLEKVSNETQLFHFFSFDLNFLGIEKKVVRNKRNCSSKRKQQKQN